MLIDLIQSGDDPGALEFADAQPHAREVRGADGLLPAMHALYAGKGELAEALLPPDDHLTVFEAAAFGCLERLHEILHQDEAKVGELSPDGFTPLHLACFSGGVAAARLLIERNAPLEALSQHATIRVRPLGTATFSGDLASAQALLDAGADPNGRSAGGFAPLHSAAQNGDLPLVQLLLRFGAHPGLALPDGRTPEVLAGEGGHGQVERVLRRARAETDLREG